MVAALTARRGLDLSTPKLTVVSGDGRRDPLEELSCRLRHPSCSGERAELELEKFRSRYLVEDRAHRAAELAAITGFQNALRADLEGVQNALSAIYTMTDDERIQDVITCAFIGLDDGGAPTAVAGPEDCY